ncbi:hypothetical protein [Stenomitos frigidus]|uniref:hypothetical protein n=1 Tax=Stenomitos frigidus TaxID=1886765 RepID=UPI0011B1DC45|nr:hypothetical protein [Stenomitos frigidus]
MTGWFQDKTNAWSDHKAHVRTTLIERVTRAGEQAAGGRQGRHDRLWSQCSLAVRQPTLQVVCRSSSQ